MTLNEIITRAASAYPECYVLEFWDRDKQCAVENRSAGDGLAEFIAWELQDTFDAEASDEEQISTAIRKIREAAKDVNAVAMALEHLKQEKGLDHGQALPHRPAKAA